MPRNKLRRKHLNGNITEGYARQSDLIVQSARKCFEMRGVKKTTLTEIAREANLTRELLYYYYYSGKQEISDRLVDAYVADAVETACLWRDTWAERNVSDDTPLPREAVVDAIAAIRRFVFSADDKRRSMFVVLDELQVREKTFARMCMEIMDALDGHPIQQRINATFMIREADKSGRNADALFKFVIFGLIGLMDASDVSNNSLATFLLMFAKRGTE